MLLRRRAKSDLIFDVVMYSLLSAASLIALYPLWFVLIASISDPEIVNRGEALFIPRGFTLQGYREIINSPQIWVGYRNTLIYTVFGTVLNVIVTLTTAYPLSRKELRGRNGIMGYFVFTMYFGGGLIPLYMLVRNLRLVNTPYVLIILGALSVYNMIIARTFFASTISQELVDAAYLDGCSDLIFFVRIALPLSKAIVAVLAVYYGVAHWNEYFSAMIFISNRKLQPLQIILRQILIENARLDFVSVDNVEQQMIRQKFAESIKYGSIIVSSLPVLLLYPFAQRYFVKGVFIGAIKG